MFNLYHGHFNGFGLSMLKINLGVFSEGVFLLKQAY